MVMVTITQMYVSEYLCYSVMLQVPTAVNNTNAKENIIESVRMKKGPFLHIEMHQ